MTITQICEAVQALRSIGSEVTVTSVSIDSRGDLYGKLFVPMKGNNVDGHDYIIEALNAGASYSLTERKPQSENEIQVKSTRKALIDLAAYRRNLFKNPVVGITGSVGKTTTKEMTATILQSYNPLKTIGNYNNDIGLPLTILSLCDNHNAMVLEMGMNHKNEITVLSRIARPNIAIITNIGDAHIENLGSREGILSAKCEIFDGMDADGIAILNGDDILLANVKPTQKTIYVGIENTAKKHNFVRADSVKNHGLAGVSCSIYWQIDGIPSDRIDISIPLPGVHNVINVLMAITTGLVLNLTTQQILDGVNSLKTTKDRLTIEKLPKFTIINDAYNASPESMRAAIDSLCSIAKGRTVCIFGDMLELGEFSKSLHEEIGEYAAKSEIDVLVTIGEASQNTGIVFAQIAPAAICKHFRTKGDFLSNWQNYIKNEDTILIKASRGMAFEDLAHFFKGAV
ncbi:MAG: UDP-N-acetylmuramoyl-tripeptide--D-alanyl-D-alanine ligase [Turicibacter sp.]|nr:UDP-N-acetylmuramoyl-tripeptide--D-alanyl-D-alanine ligase [Turicibacter sp.]